jgi:hypothetical protein
LEQIEEIDRLKALHRKVLAVASLPAFEQLLDEDEAF